MKKEWKLHSIAAGMIRRLVHVTATEVEVPPLRGVKRRMWRGRRVTAAGGGDDPASRRRSR